MANNKKQYSKEEILARLIWFHGDEFEKYPLKDDLQVVWVSKGK